MNVNTRDYGEIEVNETAIIQFEEGILGFEEYRNFVLLDDSNGESPFRCLQSLEESDLAFVVIDPFIVKPDYEITLGEELLDRLGIDSKEDVLILAIVVVPEDVSQISFNLRAPVVLNVNQRKGMQYVVDNDRYRVRHLIFEELEKKKEPAAEGSGAEAIVPAASTSSENPKEITKDDK